jgi:CRISPR type IV-associated protein Csf2
MAIEITGALVLASPAHQAALMSKGEKGPRRTQTIPVFERATDQMRTVPIISSNSVRGRLRRLAAARVFHAFEARGERISRDTFLAVSRGSVGRGEVNLHSGAEAIVEGARHVFAGMFGGGPAMLHSRYQLAVLLPMIQWTKDLLPPALQREVLPESAYVFEREGEGGTVKQSVALTSVMMWTARDPLLDGQGAGVVQDYAGTLKDWLAMMEAESAEHKAAGLKKKNPKAAAEGDAGEDEVAQPGARSALRNFGEIRVIPPGMPLQWHMTTSESASLAQEGLLLLALADFCRLNSLGGGAARGMGRFKGHRLQFSASGEAPVALFSGEDYAFNLASPAIKSRIDAAQEALSSMTAASIDAAFGLSQGKPATAKKGDTE